MNPLLLIGVIVVVAGVVIDVLNKQKQAKENDPPDETLEVSPDAKDIPDDNSSRVDDSPDSGDIPTPPVPKDSIHLDS